MICNLCDWRHEGWTDSDDRLVMKICAAEELGSLCRICLCLDDYRYASMLNVCYRGRQKA